MDRMLRLIVLFGMASGVIYAQDLVKDIPLTVTDGTQTQELRFGIAPTAIDSIDTDLGEAELPPAPPMGVFDARFIGTDIGLPQLGQGTHKDYRAGSAIFSGMKTHEISYQLGSGMTITIGWDLPMGITGLLEDLFGGVIVKQPMTGKDSYTVPNPAITKLKMTISYMVTAVEEKGEATPVEYHLSSNFPNPLRSSVFSTKIHYDLSKPGEIKIELFNLLGNHVRTLVNGFQPAGRHSTTWDGRNQAGQIAPSGIYIYRLTAGSFVQSRRMLLLR